MPPTKATIRNMDSESRSGVSPAVAAGIFFRLSSMAVCVALIIFIPAIALHAGQRNGGGCPGIGNEVERQGSRDATSCGPPGGGGQGVERKGKTGDSDGDGGSYLTKLWELDEGKPRDKYAIVIHRSNYLLPFAYNRSPSREPYLAEGSSENVKEAEVKFQLSFKVKLWQDLLGRDADLWFGYTQKSFWQLYDFSESSPFRETNYEPEMLVNFRTNFNFLGMDARTVTVGLNHQSNGRSGRYSRSWNRIVGNLGLEKRKFTLLLKTWYRIPEHDDDDNPDLDAYVGYGELWGYYLWKGHRFGVMLRNNLRSSHNRGAVQLDWGIPLTDRIAFYMQYFNGYGESLLDYNCGSNRISLGFTLIDWK
ncbi:MAG: phospholipase A [Deltaproteobacteria bacterium]|nr:phospholipase A [Deltaproteobacteria bacterium]